MLLDEDGSISDEDVVTGIGTIFNPCTEDVEYATSSSCIIGSMVYDGPTAGFEAPFCSMVLSWHTVPAMGSVSEPLMLGTLRAGDYTLTVNFNGAGGPATTVFTVDETISTVPVPEFALPDENPLSPSFGETISPSDYLGQVTGWYFIKAT